MTPLAEALSQIEEWLLHFLFQREKRLAWPYSMHLSASALLKYENVLVVITIPV